MNHYPGKLRQWRKTPLQAIERFSGLPIVPMLHGRLDRQRTANLEIPKPGVRERNESVLRWARKLGVCEVCGQKRKTEPAHVKTRGAGHPDTFENVAAACRECHEMAHEAGERGRQVLRDAIARRPNDLPRD
jgi:5-methylcytosine-specific restriction endonuclease McrA